ncbi:MAG: hypothetical protein IJA20_02680 [Methanocorpusculum sp.]|nr:hypothetical protein [Methanocorpusculum sp.]
MDMLNNATAEQMLKVLLGIISLAGILWGALRYMVGYMVNRAEERSHYRIIQAKNEVRADAMSAKKTAEMVEYRLEAHIRNEHPKLEARLRNLENKNKGL